MLERKAHRVRQNRAARGHEIKSDVVRGAGRCVDDYILQTRHNIMVTGRERRQHETHHTDIGADSNDQQRLETVLVHPIDQRVGPVRADHADEFVDAILAQQGDIAVIFQLGQLRH